MWYLGLVLKSSVMEEQQQNRKRLGRTQGQGAILFEMHTSYAPLLAQCSG